jgi:hypothetical protein
MYFSFFVYDFEEDLDSDLDKEDKMCLICWLPETDEPVKHLSELECIQANCNCDPLFHTQCIQSWIKHSTSCPICRTKLTIPTSNTNNNTFRCVIIFCKLVRCVTFMNILWIIVFQIYFYIYNSFINYNLDQVL